MRFFLSILLFFSLLFETFAEEVFLPESANPKTYRKISECYARDDITFYTAWGYVLSDWKEWKNIKIFEDGCFAKLWNRMYFNGQYFSYWDNKKSESVIVIPDNASFHLVKFQSGVFLWIDKDYIFHGNVALKIPKGFDISKMRYLQYDYMTDGGSLYYMGSADGTILRIEGIDIPSFWVFVSPMWQRFLYDKNGAYNDAFVPSKQRTEDDPHIAYINIKEMKSYPSYDFKMLTESWVFVFDSKNVYSPIISVPVDMKTFWLFPDGQLAWDKNHIFTPTGKIISWVEIWSYEYIGNGVIRSKWRLFIWCKYEIGCDGYELTGFDALSFRKTLAWFADKNGYYDSYFRPTQKALDIISYTWSTDYYHNSKNVFTHIWWDEYSVLTGANIGTFVTFSGTSYAKDTDFCWFGWIKFSCQSKSFRTLEAWRALDDTSVYYQDKKILLADPKSFTYINTWWFNWIETDHYMRDKSRVYYDDRVIMSSDPKTFILMKDLHSKDKNSIYYAWWKIEWVDYKTYTPLRYSFARDKNHFYFAGTQLHKIKNPKTVKIISRESLEYDGKIRNYWCFVSEESSKIPSCNE
jgi:hypothetical protein